jgi:hypothetical protein
LNHYLNNIVSLLGFLCLFCCAGAQETRDSVPRQKDVIDLFSFLVKGGSARSESGSQPGKIHWSAVPGAGYTLGNGFTASLTGNASFYTSAARGQNISSITAVATVTEKKQFSFVIQPNIWLPGNRLFLSGDYRYMINPQPNFGLGGSSKLDEADRIDYRHLRIYQYAFLRLGGDLFGGVGYHYNQYNQIQPVVQNGQPTNECRRYGLPATTVSSGFSLNLLFDQRRNLNNPVAGGQYLLVQWFNYLPALGSTRSWQHLVVDARKYLGLGSRSRLAFWGYGSFTLNRPPYLELPSTASDANNNMGRGYVSGRFRGRHLLYSEAEYRTPITRNGLIGAVLFANVQSVTNWPSNRFTHLHPALGGGLRIKFNKYANTNICIDYGIGMDGSRGVFVNLGEVF